MRCKGFKGNSSGSGTRTSSKCYKVSELAESDPVTVLQAQMRHADARLTLKALAHATAPGEEEATRDASRGVLSRRRQQVRKLSGQ